MSLFDRFRRKGGAVPQTPDELFDAIAQALSSDDGPRFEALCRAHTQEIVDAFPAWRTPGKDKPPAHLQVLVQVLGQTAQYLDSELGEPDPWRLLTAPADNPFVRWEAARKRIMQRVEVIDFAGAVELTHALLGDLDGLSGPGRDQQEESTRGLLGQLLRQVGRPDEAAPHLEWTLAQCEAQGDVEGMGVYLRELHEADRDRGRPSRWRQHLAAHVERHEDTSEGRGASEAAWLRDVDSRYPDGEPLLRMIVLVNGARFELDGFDAADLRDGGHVEMVFERNRQTLIPARRWVDRGREHGSNGERDEAIACFVAAAEADAHDPDSRYLHAFTLMRMNQPELALRLYDEVERLAPGWFHVRTWRSFAQRRLDGTLAHEAVEVIDILQDANLPPEQRLQITAQAISKWPRVPELFIYRGEALAELGRDAESAWLAGLELADDLPATRSRLLVALGRLDEVLDIDGANSMALAVARLQQL